MLKSVVQLNDFLLKEARYMEHTEVSKMIGIFANTFGLKRKFLNRANSVF